eukprot:c14086_g1_i1 orf=189-956(+)
MASSQAKHSRVTLVLENVKEVRSVHSIQSEDTQDPKGDCKPSSVVEHLVLFNMPYLQGDQEAMILRALYDLQFQFDNINVLIVGRVLNKADNITHGLFMRFPTVEILRAYYKSDALSNVANLMTPHLHGEICVDYVSATGYLDTNQRDPLCATATFVRRKRDVCPDEMDCALHSLVAAVDSLSYVKDFTVGSNLFLRGDKFYTHGFAGYVKAVGDLDDLAEDSHYTKVLHHQVLSRSSSTITVNVMAFKPISSSL